MPTTIYRICNHKWRFVWLILSLILLHNTCQKPSSTLELRIVSLSPAMTEVLFVLQKQERIVGVTTMCTYPEQAKNIYKVGDFSHPSLERIIGRNPNLVIVNLPEQKKISEQLKRLNVSVFVSSPSSLSDVYKEIKALGEIIGKEQTAESLVTAMQQQIKPVSAKQKKKVYIELAPRPLVTIGRFTFLNELVELAGGTNLFSDLNKDYPIIAQEEVIKRNPDIIIVLHPVDITQRLGWENISALQNGRIYTKLNQDHLLRPGPRLAQGYSELKKVINE
jgi:iron complex transport system substrate-binding protein